MSKLFDKEFDNLRHLKPEVKSKVSKINEVDSEKIATAVRHGLTEMEEIHDKYREFLVSIKELALYPHLKDFIIELGVAFEGLAEIVDGNFDNYSLPSLSQAQSKQLIEKTRDIILGDLYRKYEDKK